MDTELATFLLKTLRPRVTDAERDLYHTKCEPEIKLLRLENMLDFELLKVRNVATKPEPKSAQVCDKHGVPIIDACLICGAPQCCPKCCAEAIEETIEDARKKPEPALSVKVGEWRICLGGSPDEQIVQVTSMGTGAYSELLSFRLQSGRHAGAHVDNVQVLPPRPRDDQLPAGKVLSGNCELPKAGQQYWHVLAWPDHVLRAGFDHNRPGDSRQWIVIDAPAEAEKPVLAVRDELEVLLQKHSIGLVLQALGLASDFPRPRRGA